MGTLMNIPCEMDCATLYDIREVNSSFALGTLRIMYLGNNRNGSHFSKASVEKALPSLKNVPIVCHWDDEEKEIGGHDIALVSDDDGDMRIKNLTEPCGVVPDHAQISFETCCDENGNTHEYLVVNGVILWKRQDVYKHIVDDLGGKVKHSMEINVLNNSETEDGYYDVTDFEFTALCLLEKYEPCFQGSELELFSIQNFKQKMEQMMLEIKECSYLVNPSSEDDIHPQSYSTEGGEKTLNEKTELAEKYGIKIEDLDFSIEDISLEDLEIKFKEISKVQDNTAVVEGTEFALESNIRDELYRSLESVTITEEWGECRRYWFVDYDNDNHIVYCWDTNDWILYGFEYSVSGDSVIIDFETKKRKKFDITDFDEGDQASPIADMFAMMEEKIKIGSEFESKYQEASETISGMEAEIVDLRKFKSDTENAIAEDGKMNVFAQFEDLAGNEVFESLKNNHTEYSAEDIEEKCFAIRGRIGAAKFSADYVKPIKLKINKTDIPEKEPYGGIFTEYGEN